MPKPMMAGALLAMVLLAACETVTAPEHATPTDAADFAFMGSWDCGVTVMTFMPDAYLPSNDSEPIRVTRFAVSGDTTRITLADGTEISVQTRDDGTLGWLSHSSGDNFDCTRVAG